MKTLAERLKFAMDNATPKKIKGVDLARAVGVKPPSVSDWLSGKSRTMEGENLLRAAKCLGVDALWLANGQGEMRSSQSLSLGNMTQNQNTEWEDMNFSSFKGSFQLQSLMQKMVKLETEHKLSAKDLTYLNHFLDTVAKANPK